MSKWIKRIFLFIATLVIGLSSFGLSSWYFSKTQEIDKKIDNSNNNDGYKMDDIEENYRFGKTDEEKRYTMYFFPSAAYMFLYGRYLEDNPLYYGPHYLPEEEFGYKEVLINESGNVLTDKDGNALFKLSENTGKYQNDVNINSDTSYDGSYKLFINKHFRINDETELDGKAGSGSIYEHSQKSGRTWGSPTDTLTFDPNNKNRVEQYNGKDLFSLDRFGCWGDSYYYGYSGDENGANVTFINDEKANSSNTGRYLPIKMTVSNAMSIDLLNKVIGDVFSSMGDKANWYNFSFTNWTYVTKNNGTYSYPYDWKNNNFTTDAFKPIGEAFSAKDIDRYFDVFENLDKFADENGVIRLFPLFSNGKKYNASSYTDGGADCFKLIGDYQDNRNTSYRYFMPSSERIKNGVENFSDTKIPNSNVRYYTYNYLKLKKNHNFSSLKIAIDWTESKPRNWAGTWHDIYSLDLNYINNELINKYGDGLYNFYLFQGNFDHQSKSIDYNDFYNKIKTEAVGENGFKTLKGKSIEFINMPDLIKEYEKKWNWISYKYPSSPYNVSPVIFAFEKIVDPKIIDNVDIKEEGTNLTYESIDKLDEYIVKKSVNAHGFTRLSSPIYGRNEVGGTYNYSANSLNEKNPYTYIAKNVNFMNVKTNYFILAFSDVYISNVTIKIKSDNYSSVVINPTKDKDSGKFNYDPEDLFVNASEYIDRVTFSTGDGNDYGVLTFNNDDFKGVYDILLMFEGNNTFALYFYRHTNLFLKIFSNDLTTYQDNFLFHDETHITEAELIFKKKYFLGLTMNKDDINDMNKSEVQTLEQAITKYVHRVRGETYDLTNVRVIDHVTKTVVAKFNYINGSYVLECNQRINKNYIFYLSMK